MRKVLLALPLVASASWAGSTYYAGTQAQPAYEKLLADLNQAANGLFILESASYSAGFTESFATTNVKLLHSDQPMLFQLRHDINHSPVGSDPQGARFSASSITTTLAADSLQNEEIKEVLNKFDGGQPFTLYTDIGFTGNVITDFHLHSLSMDYEQGNISFDGGRFEATSDSGKIDVSGVIGQIAMDNGAGNLFNIAESNAQFDLQRVGTGIYTGEQRITFPNISITDTAMGSTIGIADSVFSSQASLQGENFDSTSSFSVAKILSPLPLNSFSWDAKISGLSLTGLEKHTDTMNRFMRVSGSESNTATDIHGELMSAYKGLLNPGAEFTSDIVFTNDGGNVNGDFGIKFKGDGSVSGMDNMQTLADVLQAISVNLDLQADATAIEMTPAAMFMMHPVAQQYLTSDGSRYSSNISVADLMLSVNGVQQSLEYYLGDELYEPLDLSSMADY